MATATKTAKGFKIVCIECGDADATVHLDLNDLKACVCSSCNAEFSPAEAVAKLSAQLKRWKAVAAWVAMAADAMTADDVTSDPE